MVPTQHYHEVASKISKLIDTGEFPPGSRLPAVRDLAQKFGVSRISVREAEIVLQVQGRLEVKGRSGAYVIGGAGLGLNGLPKVGPFELTEARSLFEAESAALAAPIITDETISELETLISIMSGKEKSDMSCDEADAAFHNTIARATNNDVIIFVIDSMWKMRTEAAQLQKVYRKVCNKDDSHLEDEHYAIIDALKSRDSAAARKAMRAHCMCMIEALLAESEQEAYLEVKRKASEVRSRFLLSTELN